MIVPIALLLVILVMGTSYTDWKYRKIYNKYLFICLITSFILHTINGTLIESVFTMTVAFFFFFLVYMFGMTSPGDVKLFGTIGAVVANMKVVTMTILLYMLIQLGIAIYAMVRASVRERISLWEVFKQDLIGYATKNGSVIQPIYFPGGILIGFSVLVSRFIFF